MNNVFENYKNQAWSEKELIIILNKEKRKVFDHVKFRNISKNEDVNFCEDCLKHGFKIITQVFKL